MVRYGFTSCCFSPPCRALTQLLVKDTFSLPDTSLYPSTTLEELIKQLMCIHLLILLPPLSQPHDGTSLVSQPNDWSPTDQHFYLQLWHSFVLFRNYTSSTELAPHSVDKPRPLIELQKSAYQRACWSFHICIQIMGRIDPRLVIESPSKVHSLVKSLWRQQSVLPDSKSYSVWELYSTFPLKLPFF